MISGVITLNRPPAVFVGKGLKTRVLEKAVDQFDCVFEMGVFPIQIDYQE